MEEEENYLIITGSGGGGILVKSFAEQQPMLWELFEVSRLDIRILDLIQSISQG